VRETHRVNNLLNPCLRSIYDVEVSGTASPRGDAPKDTSLIRGQDRNPEKSILSLKSDPHEHLLARAGPLSSWNPVPKRMYHTTDCFQALLSVYPLRIFVDTASADEAL